MGNIKQNRIRKYLLIHYELKTKGLWGEHGSQDEGMVSYWFKMKI